jgi:molybdopterin-guanine dinucleotide biosynthesis protein A
MTKRASLILAGGKARRFQSIDKVWQDKALAELLGKPLLIHAIENVQMVVDEIAISVNDEERKQKYNRVLKEHGLRTVKIVVDEEISGISGPNVAIMSGLRALKADFCMTLPCDMPFLKPSVAEYLFKEAEGVDVAVPMWPNGRLETLLMVLKKESGIEIAETLCKLKRPRSDDIPRGASKNLFISPVNQIKTLDPELKSFININHREDLNRLQTRRADGVTMENLRVALGVFSVSDLQNLRGSAKMLWEDRFSEAKDIFAACASNFEFSNAYFWAALSWENQGEALLKMSQRELEPKVAVEKDFEGKEAFLKAANNYRVEAEIYEEHRCWLLAERARADKAWCESWVMGKHSHTHRYPSKVP